MKISVLKLIILLICVTSIRCDCNLCQRTNNVACHAENQFSLCINDVPTRDIITCPENYVCTSGPHVCYPLPEATPSCKQDTNLCGVCGKNKVFACINETTIAFCYGEDTPVKGADVSYCVKNTVCNINSEKGFCTNESEAEPSCVTKFHTETDKNSFDIMNITTTTRTQPTTSATKQTTTTKPITMKITTECTTSTITTTAPTTTAKQTSTARPTTESTSTTTMKPAITTAFTMKPTTATTTTPITLTTPSVPRDPDVICTDAGTTGSYKVDGDPSCTRFVVCYHIGSSIRGLKKTCPEGFYFNPRERICSTTKPEGCL